MTTIVAQQESSFFVPSIGFPPSVCLSINRKVNNKFICFSLFIFINMPFYFFVHNLLVSCVASSSFRRSVRHAFEFFINCKQLNDEQHTVHVHACVHQSQAEIFVNVKGQNPNRAMWKHTLTAYRCITIHIVRLVFAFVHNVGCSYWHIVVIILFWNLLICIFWWLSVIDSGKK